MFISSLLGNDKLEISNAEKNPIPNELNTDLLDYNLVTVDHVFEIMTFFWNAIVNEFKCLVIENNNSAIV